MTAVQDPMVPDDALCRVQSLQKLCLKAIGRQLKHFCNLRLHPSVVQTLSQPEKQLIYAYDLSRLDVFEAQAFLQTINKWCVNVERKRRQEQFASKRVDRVMKNFLRYVLLPLTEKQRDAPFRELEIALGLAPAPMLQLRPTTPSAKPRRKWISGADEAQNKAGVDGDSTIPVVRCPDAILQDEIVCYRLPVASVGCGIIANMLQQSGSLVKLRLNNCQIADAGAILLTSGIRLTTTLQLLDVSNEEVVYRKGSSMDNEIGDKSVRAIALALEQNQSVKQVDLSGNPVGSVGAIALASMLQKNFSLQRLYLDRTLIQDYADTLIDVFQTSKSLNRLSMLWCRLHPGVGTRLASIQATKDAS